jgi:predicted alpha/beta hydrolase
MQEIIITAADGYQLSALYTAPPYESRHTIILSSATGIKKEFYINFTRFLVQKGYNVLLYDYRGIGEPAPDNFKKSIGFMQQWSIKDMNAALNYLANEKGVTGIIWIRHSIGPQLTDFPDNKKHIKKVIGINAALGYWALSTRLTPLYFREAFINMPSLIFSTKTALSRIAVSVLE